MWKELKANYECMSCGYPLSFQRSSSEELAIAAGAAARPSLNSLVGSRHLPASGLGSTTTGSEISGDGSSSGDLAENVSRRNLVPVSDEGSSVKDKQKKEFQVKVASDVARDHVWPYVKFILCDEDKQANSCMAKIVFDHVMLTESKASYWKSHAAIYEKCIQSRRANVADAMKKAFISK